MAELSQRARNSVALQREMFRLAELEHGLSVAVLARTRGLSVSTVKGWYNGAAMPAWALGELDLPDDLTSLVTSPYEKHIGTDEPGEIDPDGLVQGALGVVAEIGRARDPRSEGGSVITPRERAQIAAAARQICPTARAVARAAA